MKLPEANEASRDGGCASNACDQLDSCDTSIIKKYRKSNRGEYSGCYNSQRILLKNI